MGDPAYEALNFIGKNVKDLNMKDYIAAQHLLRIIDEIEYAIARLSIKADTNVLIASEIDKDPNNCPKEFVNLDKEMYLYNMYIERLRSTAYRNLVSKKFFESKEMIKLKQKYLFETHPNISKEDYLDMDEDRKIEYISFLSSLACIYKFRDTDSIMNQIHKLYDSVATIASLGFTETIILKYNPFKKLFLRKK